MESEVIEQIEGIVERYGDTRAHVVVPEALIGYKVKVAVEPEQTLTDWLKARRDDLRVKVQKQEMLIRQIDEKVGEQHLQDTRLKQSNKFSTRESSMNTHSLTNVLQSNDI